MLKLLGSQDYASKLILRLDDLIHLSKFKAERLLCAQVNDLIFSIQVAHLCPDAAVQRNKGRVITTFVSSHYCGRPSVEAGKRTLVSESGMQSLKRGACVDASAINNVHAQLAGNFYAELTCFTCLRITSNIETI